MRFIRVVRRIYSSFCRPDDRRFRTPNLHSAAVLFSRSFPLVNLDQTDPGKCQFVFRNFCDLEEMTERFDAKKPIYIEARRFIACWKLLRGKTKEERF